jgi:uncharacterized membrane protein YjfL (UPF0719 family)|tara:strand:- start:1881 stop:2408 length:528 start_codon:yes stop_codon:yes gene_type:complete
MNFNEDLFYNSLLELGISILIGTIVLYSTYKITEKYIRKKYKIETNNASYGIFCGAILFSVGYLISGIKDPILNSIELVGSNSNFSGSIFFESIKYIGLFLAISLFVILIINIISIYLFTIMTKNIDEFKELKNNNISIAIIMSIIVISICIMVKPSLYSILESFVPYPDMPRIF